jgi:hypothetical protein
MSDGPGAAVLLLLTPLLVFPGLWLVLPFIALPASRAWPTPAGAEVFHQSTGWLIVYTFFMLLLAALAMGFLILVGVVAGQTAWEAIGSANPRASLGGILILVSLLVILGVTLGVGGYVLWDRVWKPWRNRRLPLLIINDAGLWSPGFKEPLLWADLSAAEIWQPRSGPAKLVLYQGAPKLQLVVLVRPVIASVNLNQLKGPIRAVAAAIKDKRFRPD